MVEHGYNVLEGADHHKIVLAAKSVQSGSIDFTLDLYGDGNASSQIVSEMKAQHIGAV